MRYLAIVGPTCIGKTQLLNAIVERHPIEVINLDSFQVYMHFSLGTGRNDITTNRAHLYGFADPRTPLAPYDYLSRVKETLANIASRNRMPLFEGGWISYLRPLAQIYPLRIVASDHRPRPTSCSTS